MNKFLALFFAFGALFASALPAVVFDKKLLEGKDDRFLSVFHGNFPLPVLGAAKNHRFLFLVPKLGADFGLGFKSGLTPKPLDFLNLGADEHLTGLFGFSDCKEWFAVGVSVFGAAGETTKFFSGVKGVAHTPLGGLDALVEFLHDKLTADAFKGLVKLLPSHPVVHKLHVKFAPAL